MKRFLSAILSVCLAFSCIATALAASFPDIDGHFGKDAIEYMVSKGVVNGYQEDGTFRPNRTVTRAEFIKMLNVTFGLTATKNHSYSDVSDGQWFDPYVRQATAQGYLLNYGTMLNPSGPLSRQEAAALLVRYLDPDTDKKAPTSTFTDYNTIKAAYREYVLLAAGTGLINGYPDGTFDPDRTLTRAEALTILYRAAGTICNDNLVESEAGAGKDNAVITQSGVTVTGANLPGRVLISEGVSGGTVTLSECQIGELIIRGTPSLIMNGCTVDSILVDSAAGHTASVSILNGTVVKSMTLSTPADISMMARTTLGSLVVEKTATRSSVTGSGTFTKAEINASGFISEKVPTQYTLARGISATFADKVYTSGSTPAAGDTGFTIQPSAYATSVDCYLTLTTAANGTVYYYFTNTAAVPTSALFESYYAVASARNNYVVTANRSSDTKIGQTAAVDNYSYIAVMFTDANGVDYQPVVIANMASNGFITAPTINATSTYQYLAYTPAVSGTVYYYYTNSATALTVSSFTNAYTSNATMYTGELVATAGQASSQPTTLASNVSGYNYVAVMLMDDKNNQYQPILVPVNGSSASTSTGFTQAPYANSVANGVALGFTAAYSGTVEYYFTNSSTVPTVSEFDTKNSLTQVGLRGSTSVSANTAVYAPLLNLVSTTSYPYIVVRLKSTGGVAYTPVVVRINSSSSTTPDQPGAAGSGFTTQPVVTYSSGKYNIRFQATANGTLYYYLTNYKVAPSSTVFINNYNAATGINISVKIGGSLATTGATQTAQTVLATSLGESYDYMVIMLQKGNTYYTPIIVEVPDAEETALDDTGFLVGPIYNTYQSTSTYYRHQIEFCTSITGTVWYYFTDDATVPTPSAVKENVVSGGTGIYDASYESVTKNKTKLIPVTFTSTPPAYLVIMLTDNNYNNYRPLVISTTGIAGASNMTSGFFKTPTVTTTSGTPVLNYEANETGKLYYFFTNTSTGMNTVWDFFLDDSGHGYLTTYAEGVKGVVSISAGKGSAFLTTARSVAGYTHVAIMMQSAVGETGGFRAPILIPLNGSTSGGNSSTTISGFKGTPYVSGTNLNVTPLYTGTLYYGFTNSNSTADLYEPISALGGISGIGGAMNYNDISSIMASYNNGSSKNVIYPGYNVSVAIPASNFLNYKYVAVWMVTTGGEMTSPVFVPLGSSGGSIVTNGTGFSVQPKYNSWTNQISFTPVATGRVAYFYTNSTANYGTSDAFINAYHSASTAQIMDVLQGQGNTISVTLTNYKYVWLYLYTTESTYTPVRIQIG